MRDNLPPYASPRSFLPRPDVAGRLREALALLQAIEAGELLAAAPVEAADRGRHEMGLAVLSVLGRELERLLSEVRAHDEMSAFNSLEGVALGYRSPQHDE
jgi:hypothetical protein